MSGVTNAQVKIAHVNTAEILDVMPDKAKAEKDLEMLQQAVAGSENDVNDTAPTFKTLEEGRIEPKDRAKHILLAEEMFALCCRACGADADVKIECAIKPEENILHLKMLAPMDGKDPLDIGGDASGGIAANYIRSHTQRATFEAGVGRDMLEIISELS